MGEAAIAPATAAEEGLMHQPPHRPPGLRHYVASAIAVVFVGAARMVGSTLAAWW
jgi:hypothetical protein